MPVIAPLRFSAPPVSAMSLFEQKNFERFVILAPPKFNGTVGYGAYDFLTECQDRLFNLGILKAHKVTYTSYQFAGMAKKWWRSVMAEVLLMLQQ